MHVLNLRKVSVSYDAAEVLADVELDIYDDDFLAVIGPNGGGKTTLVKAILGLIPYNGTIQFLGGLSGPEEIGYLPQINNIDKSFPISVKDTILSGLQNKGQLSGKIFRSLNSHNKAEALMDMVGVYDLKQRHIGTLSGGELQRVLLCRALISEPKLLILDEPANFVDNAFEKELYEILKSINDRMAIIMVSHDIGTITSYVKSVVCVNRTVHRHKTNELTAEMLQNYNCPLQVISHGEIPHTILDNH